MDYEQIKQAAAILDHSRNVVALTGAGIGRPSGIPDFRSDDGLWSKDNPMEVASITTLQNQPQRFFDWLRPLLDVMLAAQPNPAHTALVQLEQAGILQAIVTQNIDSLHQRAGSQTVYELHGHGRTATCMHCQRQLNTEPQVVEQVLQGKIPHCDCGQAGMLKPDIVLFGEMLPQDTFASAVSAIEMCDTLLVVGTSLEVHPAASLPLAALQHRASVIIINLDSTYIDGYADVVLHEDMAVVMPAIIAAMSRY
ncbi:MAG: NAD-dependent deacylase, partial [Chloroflexaceae bacterium]|nr:NAD-dependent deacylase [Chloroflexaceae bacterium]